MARRSLDPTLDEMRSYLVSQGLDLNDPSEEFDIEEAIYWFSCDYHSGQQSNLYSASCQSLYIPSPISSGPASDYAYKLLKDYYVEQY